MVGSQIGCVVFLCEIEKKMKDLARKGLTKPTSRGGGNCIAMQLL